MCPPSLQSPHPPRTYQQRAQLRANKIECVCTYADKSSLYPPLIRTRAVPICAANGARTVNPDETASAIGRNCANVPKASELHTQGGSGTRISIARAT